jgi:hypothetical protein
MNLLEPDARLRREHAEMLAALKGVLAAYTKAMALWLVGTVKSTHH